MTGSRHLRVILVCDGTSDAALEHPFRWILRKHGYSGTLDFQIAPPNEFSGHKLENRIRQTIQDWTPNLLLIHRDSEKEPFSSRLFEIENAVRNLGLEHWIPIIPVRMLESWLLFDEMAIRIAAGNPNGKANLNLPKKISLLEGLPDPKSILFEALKNASELSGRRLSKFTPHRYRHLVAEEISDFTSLLTLNPFADFSERIKKFLAI